MSAQPKYDPALETLVRKIGVLPAQRVAEVEDFVDFIGQREQDAALNRDLSMAARAASAPSFAVVWSNPADDVYDGI
jgi:hypothetical protein